MALSVPALRSLLAFESSDGIVLLVTVTAGAAVLRFARNNEDIKSRGDVFTAFPFDLALGADNDQGPVVSIRIANVDRQITDTLMGLKQAPSFLIEVVMFSTPNIVERSFDSFVLRNFQADALAVTAELSQDRFSSEPWPRFRATPSITPNYFL